MADDTIVMTDKLRAELAGITSTQRAAVLMLLLGEEQAAEIIKFLSPKEVQALGAAMVQVANFSQEAVNFVLDEFVDHLKKQNNVSIGGADYVEKVMRLALGDDKAASVLGRIMPGQGTKGLDILSWMDARGIADMIRGEHPQVVAIILSLLESEVAADVLNYLPPDVRPEVIQRVASLDTVQPSAMAELEAIMKQQFSKNASAQSSSFGGVQAAAKIMNMTKTALENSIMSGLNEIDPELMLKIQDNMFTFENLVSVDNKGIQVLMRAVEPDLLMMALKNASEECQARFFDNMSERARGMFRDDMEAKGPQRMADVEDAQKLSSRGYATTRWTTDEPEAFADLGYPAKSSGFSADHYQPMRQPLSKQAQASLDLLEGEYRNESFGEEKPASKTSAATNEHLPFVMDHFGATRKSKLRVNVDSSVLQRAIAHADLAETLEVSPITSDDRIADPIVIHPDVYDDEPTAAHDADVNAAADQDAEAQADAELSAVDAAREETSDEASEPAEGAAEEAAEALAETAAPEAQEPAEPELPAMAGGIAPEEVAQREAEQFAKGLAQGREEAAAEMAAAIEAAKSEATEQALAQGKAEGLAEGLQQGLEQGKAQGLTEGEQTVREAMTAEMAAQRVLFENASNELSALLKDSNKFFEPLKRLALHIAEQVVLGELQTSTQALERLVQRCLDELDHPVQGAVVLELNPEDKARMQAHAADFIKGMRLEAVHDMQPGSVRVFANDTVVEDLLDHRLEAMAKALLVDEKTWREQSILTPREPKIEVVVEATPEPEPELVVPKAASEEEMPETAAKIEEEEDGDVHS